MKYDLGSDFTLQNSFFRTTKLTKNAYLDKYSYFGYGIGYAIGWCMFSFWSSGGGFCKTVVIFIVLNSSSVYGDNRNI